jgi:hypothetical protein
MISECREQKQRIARSFLGDLSAAEKQALEDHLSKCPLCRSEQASYAETLNLLQSSIDDSIPRHFFINPQERESNPWQLFCRMKPGWQALMAVAAGLFVLIGISAVSSLQIRTSSSGWSLSFGADTIDVAALKEDILKAAEQKNREAEIALIRQVRAEIARSGADLSQKQQEYVAAALTRWDKEFSGRMVQSEDRLRADAQRSAVILYQTVALQRAQDLNMINARFDTFEAVDVIKDRQNSDILSTLLQVAELKLK